MKIERLCDQCGRAYVAESKRGRFCSPRCRGRAHTARQRTGEVIVAGQPVAPVPRGTAVSDATRGELSRLGKMGTPQGATALVLAGRLDEQVDTGSSIAAVVRELRATLAELSARSPVTDVVDELRARREARRRMNDG